MLKIDWHAKNELLVECGWTPCVNLFFSENPRTSAILIFVRAKKFKYQVRYNLCRTSNHTVSLFWHEAHCRFVALDIYTRFAWAGGTCPRFTWAGGTFFPVVLLCQFLVLAGNRFWLSILLCTWSTIQLWCCVSYFGSGGK